MFFSHQKPSLRCTLSSLRLLSSAADAGTSRMRTKYSFIATPSFRPQNPNPQSVANSQSTPSLRCTLSSLRLLSSDAGAGTSRLRTEYSFVAPPSFCPQNPNPQSVANTQSTSTRRIRKNKPAYRPPSSLETGAKPLRSDLPFDFRYSYTESDPAVKPIGLREPKYSPFGPGQVDREWTGVCAPASDPKVRSVDGVVDNPKLEEKRKKMWEVVQGKPLIDAEKKILVESCQRHRTKKQINLGRDGLTHNMLDDIHNHWKHAEAVRIKCMGVPTVDMKNVCTHLEDKTLGKIIHRHGGLLVLYRGRHYHPKKRPVIPLMLWKPQEPIYPKLIKTTIDGLSIAETKEMRKRGLAVPVLAKLARNGYYGNLVAMVRDAFLPDELVRIDCQSLDRSDCKKIGVKLRDLVPCILVSFEKQQIVIWRGANYQRREDGLFLTDRGSFDDSDNQLWGSDVE